MIRRCLVALCFLTRLPVSRGQVYDARDVGRSSMMFPLVGALIGGLSIGAAQLWLVVWPQAWSSAAFVATATTMLTTGALHQDALADMVDGFGGGRTREDVLRIMRDSAIGSFGTVALVLALLARVTCIATLLAQGHAWSWVITAAAVSRAASTVVGWWAPYAHADSGKGLGRAITDHVGPLEVLVATSIALAIVRGLGTWGFGVLLLAAILTFSMVRRCMRRLGGVTGDTLGATTELIDVAILLLGASVTLDGAHLIA